jgi:hypothetical protein
LKEQKILIGDVFRIITQKGWTVVGAETSLGLEIGTFHNWGKRLYREGHYLQPEEVALLKILRAFPWIINVSAGQFNPALTKGHLLHAAADLMIDGGLK